MKRFQRIKKYFEANGGRPVTTEEFRALWEEEKEMLAQLVPEEIGVKFE